MSKISKNNMPNFYILGAAKSGTTTLYEHLSVHPDIYFPENKEPQFFCNEELFGRGINFYLETFYKGAEGFKLRGDATPHYLYYEKVAERIKENTGDKPLKFIVILRDPVYRAYSLYQNMCYEGYDSLSFEEAIEQEADRLSDSELDRLGTLRYAYVRSGLYADQLQKYLKYFDRDAFHIVFYQDLVKEPEVVLGGIYDFLGISHSVLSDNRAYNLAGVPRFRWLQSLLRNPVRGKKLLGKLLPHHFKYRIVTFLLSLNKKNVSYVKINKDTEFLLRQAFQKDIARLELMTGRNLDEWKAG